MSLHEDSLGRIQVSPSAIAALVTEAVKESYGVVGMSRRGLLDELASSLPARRTSQRTTRRGVEINPGETGVIVDVFVDVAYGTRITEVASGVMRRVFFTLTRTAGIPVEAVNVHVQDLRVISDDDSDSL